MAMTYLIRSPISLDALLAEVSAPACGGTCVFLGTVRDGPEEQGVTAIEYSAYEEMVEGELGRIVAEVRERWSGARVAGLGVHKVRLTGGEPLLRHDLPTLVEMIARDARITDLALTTNGLLLAKHAAALQAAGLQRATVSLDTLRPERMLAFAKSPRHADVLEGIAAARKAGFAKLKLNAVVIRGFNDDELADLVEFARTHDAEVRRSE